MGHALLVIQDDAFWRSKDERQVFVHVCSFLRNVFSQIEKPTTFQINQANTVRNHVEGAVRMTPARQSSKKKKLCATPAVVK
jgi:hypothetical protein